MKAQAREYPRDVCVTECRALFMRMRNGRTASREK